MEGHPYVCVYGHFYQPPRENPFTGIIPQEPGAEPYANFNEKITEECYRPNLDAGSFERMSFDVGPTLAVWLERAHPDLATRIVAADRAHLAHYGVGNALAQPYIHSILPLATHQDRQTLICWGLADFAHHYGHPAEGMWLPETAVDVQTLDVLAGQGIRYTVLAPWQAAEPIDPTEPAVVRLPSGRAITVFFYHGPLSGAVSFDDQATTSADRFAAEAMPAHLNREKAEQHVDQLLLIASDGEVYGHHKPWRDQFLARLLTQSIPAQGYTVTTLGRYLVNHPAAHEVTLRVPSSWSCSHGLARWSTGCTCTAGDASWKPALRRALDRLSARLDERYGQLAGVYLSDPWAARNDAIGLHEGWLSEEAFWTRWGKQGHKPSQEEATRTLLLLEAQYYGELMYTSCGLFIEDLDQIEPRNDIACARKALSLCWQATGVDLQADFTRHLAFATSWRTGKTGADLYRALPPVAAGLLPEAAPAGAAR